MHFLCTICSESKRDDPEPLPARERYLSDRIARILEEGRRLGAPVLILSGKHGLLTEDEEIPWYDVQLTSAMAPYLAVDVQGKLRDLGARRVTFYAEDRDMPGWTPYYEVLESACRACDVRLEIRRVN